MKREVRAAFERRAIREALEKKIREVLRTPPSDRTPEQLELLREHASVVAPLMANLERSLRRKTQTEERLEEREAGGGERWERGSVRWGERNQKKKKKTLRFMSWMHFFFLFSIFFSHDFRAPHSLPSTL